MTTVWLVCMIVATFWGIAIYWIFREETPETKEWDKEVHDAIEDQYVAKKYK